MVKNVIVFWGEEKKWRILINEMCDIKIIAAVNNKCLNIR